MSVEPPGSEIIGCRVSVRLHSPEGGYRDIVGTLMSENSLLKRDGATVTFDPGKIVAWRKVAPPTQRAGKGSPLSLRVREMEIVAARTWPAAFQESVGEWELRATGKYTMRANSVLVLGNPVGDFDEAIQKVIDFYESHHLPPVFHVPLPTFEALDRALDGRGWTVKTRAVVMVKDIGQPIITDRSEFEWKVSDSFDDEWLQLQNDAGVSEIMKSAPAFYAGLKVNGALAAVGRAANFEDWTVLTRLFVHADFRRNGIGAELISRLLSAAQKNGATKALLQVDAKNAPAISAYEKFGFVTHHSYCYRVLPTQPAAEC